MKDSKQHELDVDGWMKDFADGRRNFEDARGSIRGAIVARLKDDGLNYHAVQSRVKDNESLRKKLSRTLDDGSPKYEEGVDAIDDVIGLRIITYLEADVERGMEALKGSFEVLEHVNKTAQQKEKGAFGYSGQHMVLRVGENNPPSGCSEHKGLRFEVQFRTILQHAWAEFEHDIRYKGSSEPRPEVNRAFTLASGLIELADREFSNISVVVSAQRAEEEAAAQHADEELAVADLQDLLEQNLPDNPRSRAEQYDWLLELLNANGVTSSSAAVDLFKSADWQFISDKINYKFEPGHVRIVDDFLLSHWGQNYIQRTQELGGDEHRREKLQYRLKRLTN